jgi:hypothetical protein
MGLFGRKTKAEAFGAMLRSMYSDVCEQTVESFRQQESEESESSTLENLEAEVAALMYFAFDLAMASGSETKLRSRIRDGFLSARSISEPVAQFVSLRADEYAEALRSREGGDAMFAIGSIFANHVGDESLSTAMRAAHQFSSAHGRVSDLVSDSLRELK